MITLWVFFAELILHTYYKVPSISVGNVRGCTIPIEMSPELRAPLDDSVTVRGEQETAGGGGELAALADYARKVNPYCTI